MTIFADNLPLLLLIISLLALLVGPVLFYLTGVSQTLWRGIDAFVLIAVGGIVFFHILPDAYEKLGWPALVVALTSLYLPVVFEKITNRVAQTAHNITLGLALVGLVLHAFTDGLALIAPELAQGHIPALPMAVILHRIPDGITIWWLLHRTHGRKVAIRTILLISIATILGFYFGRGFHGNFPQGWFGLFEALLGGALLHVIFHASPSHSHSHDEKKQQTQTAHWPEGLGSLLAITGLVLFFNSDSHAHIHESDFLVNFLDLALQSAPALVLAYLLSGVLDVFFNKAPVGWLSRGGFGLQALKGMITGLPLPLCSCGVIPVYRSLVLKRVPLAATLAFLVATPEFSIDAFILSLPLLGGQMTLIRIVFAGVVAFVVGYVVARFLERASQNSGVVQLQDEQATKAQGKSWRSVLKYGFGNSFDDTMPWILVGLTLAAIMAPVFRSHTIFTNIPDLIEVPLMALLGMPMYVCASGATPLVAALMVGGISPGAALAFLLTGPATNATTYGILSQLHGKKIAVGFMLTMLVVTVFLGIGVNQFVPHIDVPSWHPHEHGTWHLLQWGSLIVLTVTLLVSLMRNGPRKLLENILRFDTQLEAREIIQADNSKKTGHDCCH